MSFSREILAEKKLRNTPTRKDILEVFIRQDSALSQPEIEQELQTSCDRVTIYRTLTTFLEKGIIHKVLDDAGAMKYALCSPVCHESDDHNHDHVHFKCLVCGDTTCINEVNVPRIELPTGFESREVNILMQGTCPKCK